MDRARHSTTSFEWRLSDWDAGKLTVMQRRWREHCQTFGLNGGLCVMDFRPGETMLLLVCGKHGNLDTHDRLALFFSGQEAVARIRDITSEENGLVTLSRRERECLQWVAAGKTDWEIGQILSLSEKNGERLRRACETEAWLKNPCKRYRFGIPQRNHRGLISGL